VPAIVLSIALAVALVEGQAHAGVPLPGAGPETIPAGTVVREVRLLGLTRVAADTVRAVLATRVGDPADVATIAADARRVYALGLFLDVDVALEGDPGDGVVVLTMTEKPVARAVDLAGNHALARERFIEVIDLRPGDVVDGAALHRTAGRIRERYREEGYLFASVEPRSRPAGPGEVDVCFVVAEGDPVTVRRVNFTGNAALSDAALAARMETKARDAFSWLGSGARFHPAALERDVAALGAAYQDAGYLAAKVRAPRVTLDALRREVDVDIHVDEGPRYRAGAVHVTGELGGAAPPPPATAADLERALRLHPGAWFSRAALGADADALTRRWRDAGHAFCVVTPATDVDAAAHTVGVRYDVRPGPRVRIARIEVHGHRITAEGVIRERLHVSEGDFYSETGVERSRADLESTGYFESVAIASHAGPAPDLLVLDVTVKEAKTGSMGMAVESSGADTYVVLATSVANVFGTGLGVEVRYGLSFHRVEGAARVEDPRFFGSRLRLRAEVFNSTFVLPEFSTAEAGGSLLLGWEPHPAFAATLRYALYDLQVGPCGSLGCAFEDPAAVTLLREGRVSAVSAGVAWERFDDRAHATRGARFALDAEVADPLIGARLAFTKITADVRFAWPLLRSATRGGGIVLKLHVRGALVLADGARDVPVSERLFEGGLGSVRGFGWRTLGPLARLRSADPFDPLRLVNIGGTAALVVSAEIELPLVPKAGLRGVVFFDAGNAWGGLRGEPDVNVRESEALLVRLSAGFGIRWAVPVGAIVLEWGFPLVRDPLRAEAPFELHFGLDVPF
jgi:outer membrane protein insertion porin family